MAEKYREERVEEGFPESSGLEQFMSHCRKFWWFHVILLSAILVAIILPFVFVAYPNMAQQDVNDSTLTIKSMVISDPAPDSFHIVLTQVIGSKSKFHPVLDAFNASVSMLGSSVPFAYLNTPRVQSHDGVEGTIDQKVVIPDLDSFTAFSVAVMQKEEVNLVVSGKTGLKLGSLPKINVTYNKNVTTKGLNALKGFNVTAIHLVLPPEDDGTNMRGTIIVPNPSVMTLYLGNVTLDLSVDGTSIGQSRLQNVVVSPGDNRIEMASTVNETIVLGLVSSPDSKYKNGVLPIDILGNSSVYNDQELPYFSKALASNKLRVNLNITSL